MPNDAASHYQLAMAYSVSGRYGEALRAIDGTFASAPSQAELRKFMILAKSDSELEPVRDMPGFNAMLDGTSDFRATLLIVARMVFILLGLGAGSVIAASFGGPICVFLRSYALFYYGGHYKPLGNLLEPGVPVSTANERVAEAC